MVLNMNHFYLSMCTTTLLNLYACNSFKNHLFSQVHNGYLFALPERDAEGRRVIFSVARLDTKTMIIFDNEYNDSDDSDDDGGPQEPRPNPTHELRCTEGAHHHIWGNQHILNCSLLQITRTQQDSIVAGNEIFLCRPCSRKKRTSWKVSSYFAQPSRLI